MLTIDVTSTQRTLTFIALAAPNLALGVYLTSSGFRHMAHADGTGEGLLGMLVGFVGLGLLVFALPALHWARGSKRRDERANRKRLVIAAALTLISSVPVAITWYSL